MSKLLIPLRLMGNDAAHQGGDVSKKDLLATFEVIEHLLDEEFHRPRARAAAISEGLSLRFGKSGRAA